MEEFVLKTVEKSYFQHAFLAFTRVWNTSSAMISFHFKSTPHPFPNSKTAAALTFPLVSPAKTLLSWNIFPAVCLKGVSHQNTKARRGKRNTQSRVTRWRHALSSVRRTCLSQVKRCNENLQSLPHCLPRVSGDITKYTRVTLSRQPRVFFFLLLPYFSVFSKETEGRRPKQRRPLMMSCCEDSNSFVQLTNKSGVKPQQKLRPQEPNIKHVQ